MTWKLTEAAQALEPIPGIPWQDLEDEAYREHEREYIERFLHLAPEPEKPSEVEKVERRRAVDSGRRDFRAMGYFEHVDEKAPAKEPAAVKEEG